MLIASEIKGRHAPMPQWTFDPMHLIDKGGLGPSFSSWNIYLRISPNCFFRGFGFPLLLRELIPSSDKKGMS